MEFRTSQGGETILVFEPQEEQELRGLARRTGADLADIKLQLTKQRQAHPLAGFTELLGLAFQGAVVVSGGGLAPATLQKLKKPPGADPLDALEADIRHRLRGLTGLLGSNATSQTMQVEASLLQALATVLQTRELRRLAEVEDG